MNKSLIITILLATTLTACFDQRSERQEDLDTEQIQYPIPEGGNIHLGEHGKEVWFAYGAMNGVGDTPANGVAQAHQFEDGFYLHTVSLNIAPAGDGYFYEGWLVHNGEIITSGHMSNYFGDSRHSLRFESETPYPEHLKVVVTLEPDDGDPAPAEHVAEGTMKVSVR